MVKELTAKDLQRMRWENGLAFLDCQVPPLEVLSEINRSFTYAGILRGQSEIKEVMTFPRDGTTDVLLPFGKAVLEPVKLAAWQIMAYPDCRAVFFSDYIPSRLRGKEVRLPLTKNSKKGGHTHDER